MSAGPSPAGQPQPGDSPRAAALVGFPPPIAAQRGLDAGQWGMIAFLVSEGALFGTLLMTYATFLGADTAGPAPRDVLSLPLVICTTICLLSSSLTMHLAEKRLQHSHGTSGGLAAFNVWWGITIALGAAFLAGTAYEWRELIERHGLSISRNLFGTTYYTLVGFHAAHVTIGVLAMAIVLGLILGRQFNPQADPGQGRSVQLVGWYWHFVDAVWIVVFTLVYIIGR
ncbi:MAG TPA: heme-copper oxidase subunit III [Pirellulales bacterium]|jgi:cytochrome c oxidase subunit 3/cytochrome o ubiquinol oxidase subunit 3|nr:heme-copper oxidase subunit III [Pirellulales bacterium]